MNQRGRNEKCWCGSGKKYKKCHLEREKQERVNRNEANSILRLFTSVSKCSVPESMKHECQRRIVKAHTLSKSNSLKEIAKDGHVLGLKKGLDKFEKNNGMVSFDKMGVNQASTFTGFCSYHDKVLFSCIEDDLFIEDKRQCTMLAYRPLMREVYVKEANLKVLEESRSFDKGQDFQSQLAWAKYINENIEGTKLTLSDLNYIRGLIEASIRNNQYDALEHIVIRLQYPPKIMACSIYAPIVDIDGCVIQEITSDVGRPEYVIANVLALDGKGYVIFSWLSEDDKVIPRFISSIKKCPSIKLGDRITNHILTFVENIFASEDWWESQKDNQEFINELMMQGVRMHMYDLELIIKDNNKYNAITVSEVIDL
ncbi:SEC-C metal-binding domain-containing protein [Enterobacter cloacae]|uniref:SEC-C metal-binding domain-containing protein n=1 Tax=Enterobacter cloacae TaxID=550 RepID=UPI0013D2F53D|nr:SEC-C metal-binding domain-containing protein [Enterobacter cloacae]